jgi:hypothetical protein
MNTIIDISLKYISDVLISADKIINASTSEITTLARIRIPPSLESKLYLRSKTDTMDMDGMEIDKESIMASLI